MPAQTLGVLLVWLAVLFLPGLVVAAAAGLRTSVAVATAPLITYGLATAAGTAAGVVDLPWEPGFLAAEAGLAGAALWLLRTRGRRRPRAVPRLRRPAAADLPLIGGVVLGGVVSMAVLYTGFGAIDRPNQDWDYTFHANATRFIADTGDVAPSALRAVNDWENPSFFYPNAYHAVAALVRDLTGAPVFSVLNTHTLLIGALAGLGLAVLLRELGAPAVVTATTPVLLAGFTSFPYDVIWRGPLLPYATGLALMPAFLLLVRAAVDRRRPADLVLAALGGTALFGLQPSTALSGGLLGVLLVTARWAARRRADLREAAVLGLAAVLVALLAAPEVLGSVRASTSGAQINWPAVESAGAAAGQLMLLDPGASGPQLCLAALVLIGLLTLRSARYMWWWLAGAAVAFGLFVLAASSDAPLVESLTRPWWNDRWRFSAWVVLGMAPLAAHGLHRTAAALTRVGMRRGAALTLVLAAVALLSNGLSVTRNSRQVATAYQSEHFLDDAEIAAMAWLGPRVGPGETVMNDPGDGSAYLAALEGVRPLFGHQVHYSELGPTQKLLLQRFDCLDSDLSVRDAIADLDVRYVFLGTGFLRAYMHRVQGLRWVYTSPSLHLVYSAGGVHIYRVDLRPRVDTPLLACRTPVSASVN